MVVRKIFLGSEYYSNRYFFKGKIIDVAEVNQLRWLVESVKWLENVDGIHLVVARCKPVLKKLLPAEGSLL